jgi:hypothetical protein
MRRKRLDATPAKRLRADNERNVTRDVLVQVAARKVRQRIASGFACSLDVNAVAE